VADQLTGIAIPIEFRTNKITRASRDDGPLIVGTSRHVMGQMELYFSPHAITLEHVDLAEPGKPWTKERTLYQKHNVHGDHQFLIPSTVQKIEADRYLWPSRDRFAFGLVNGSPTTATGTEVLQLIPCDKENLALFLERLQTQPFYIEVRGDAFILHVKDRSGTYRKIASQIYSPRCWHGTRHAVITTQGERTYQPILRLESIPWTDVAELGDPPKARPKNAA
jgi:hypothetical protein